MQEAASRIYGLALVAEHPQVRLLGGCVKEFADATLEEHQRLHAALSAQNKIIEGLQRELESTQPILLLCHRFESLSDVFPPAPQTTTRLPPAGSHGKPIGSKCEKCSAAFGMLKWKYQCIFCGTCNPVFIFSHRVRNDTVLELQLLSSR